MKSITYQRNGATLTLPTGFSWTTLIFGWWPSIFRSHWRLAWTLMAVDMSILWFVVEAFQGRDYLFTALVLRGVAAYYRNEELHKDVQKDGWRTEASLAVVSSK